MMTLKAKVLFSIALATSITTSADILVGGNIEQEIRIDVEQIIAISDLDLTKDTNGLLIAVASANSNSSAGYNVTITTMNEFQLVSPSSDEIKIDYQLYFGVGDVQALSQQGQPAFRSGVISNGETHRDVKHEIKMTYQGTPDVELIAGDYSDTIEITIQAN